MFWEGLNKKQESLLELNLLGIFSLILFSGKNNIFVPCSTFDIFLNRM